LVECFALLVVFANEKINRAQIEAAIKIRAFIERPFG